MGLTWARIWNLDSHVKNLVVLLTKLSRSIWTLTGVTLQQNGSKLQCSFPWESLAKGEQLLRSQEKTAFPLTGVITFKPLPKKAADFHSWIERTEERKEEMLCYVNKYSTWRGIKKPTKPAVKYLHLWRFRQNIKSSCTVKSPFLFLSLLHSACPFLLFLSVLRAAAIKKDHLWSQRDGAGGWLAGWGPEDGQGSSLGKGLHQPCWSLCENHSYS